MKLSHAKGHTYGEPNSVWSSLKQPENHKVFVEFSMAIDDPRFNKFAGAAPDKESGVNYYKGRGNDFTIVGDVKPEEFIAIHEPWHHTYRYIIENNMVEDVLKGQYDYLLDGNFPNEAKAVLVIKNNFGK